MNNDLGEGGRLKRAGGRNQSGGRACSILCLCSHEFGYTVAVPSTDIGLKVCRTQAGPRRTNFSQTRTIFLADLCICSLELP